MRIRSIATACAALLVVQLSNAVWAQFPTAPSTETTTSLGQFTIVVNPAFQPLLANALGPGVPYPGYTATGPMAGLLTSPLLYDPGTQIDLSASLQAGSSAYTNGLPVGSPNNGTVSNGSITLFPSSGYTPPTPGTDMVFTQIHSFNLAASGASVTAGAAATVVPQPASVGEVISQSSSGLPANDFPANSFFDVFVDVTLPDLAGGSNPQTLINNVPLIVQSIGITTLPPTVIYTHGNSSAVPLVFPAGGDPAIGGTAGEVFGVLTLSGHGVGYSNSDQGSTGQGTNPYGPTSFENSYDAMLANPADLMPLPAADASWSSYVPALPEPSSLTLLAVGVIAATRRHRRSRAA